MRITRANVERLIEIIDELRDPADEWINLQDEPNNEEIREAKADARESIEEQISELESLLKVK